MLADYVTLTQSRGTWEETDNLRNHLHQIALWGAGGTPSVNNLSYWPTSGMLSCTVTTDKKCAGGRGGGFPLLDWVPSSQHTQRTAYYREFIPK